MMSGTAHIIVGWSTLASPLLPFRTLVDMSVIVLGEEYPTLTKKLQINYRISDLSPRLLFQYIEINCFSYLNTQQHHRIFRQKLEDMSKRKVCNVAFVWFWVQHEHDALHACHEVTMSQYDTLKR